MLDRSRKIFDVEVTPFRAMWAVRSRVAVVVNSKSWYGDESHPGPNLVTLVRGLVPGRSTHQ